MAVDAVFDSVSIATTFREELGKAGVIFCSISEAVKEYPDLVRKHMGSVVSFPFLRGEGVEWQRQQVGGVRRVFGAAEGAVCQGAAEGTCDGGVAGWRGGGSRGQRVSAAEGQCMAAAEGRMLVYLRHAPPQQQTRTDKSRPQWQQSAARVSLTLCCREQQPYSPC